MSQKIQHENLCENIYMCESIFMIFMTLSVPFVLSKLKEAITKKKQSFHIVLSISDIFIFCQKENT